jgi:hypothetical protein
MGQAGVRGGASTAQKQQGELQRERIAELYKQFGGNVTKIAQEMGIARGTVHHHIEKMGGIKKPIAAGSIKGTIEEPAKLPTKNAIKRYILTSAQNNTYVNKPFWHNLLALAEHYKAKILVGTFSYNQNHYGELAVKKDKAKEAEEELWFDPAIEPYICDDRIELGEGLVWCGEMNIMPTAEDPLSGLETYSHRKSAIFPHVKLAMRSIATMQGEGTKLNYTTGTTTLKNYIQKKAGLKAEHHHSYSCLVVEVNHEGNWWVRQVGAAHSDCELQDLDVKVKDGVVTTNNTVEAITWGDLHATIIDPVVEKLSQDMLDTLKPKVQFLHDVMEGVSVNHHEAKNPHAKYKAYLRGLISVENEVETTIEKVKAYERPWSHVVVVDSNHDNWITKWLQEHDYRQDPINARFFLEAQLATYQGLEDSLEEEKEPFHMLEWAMRKYGCPESIQFLRVDESYRICNDKIECGQHGHLGPNGQRGTPQNLNKIGRRANTAHTHSAGIYNGLFVAGTSTKLRWDYAKGPSSWSWSHTVTYPNGMRAIVTMFAGRWRA